MGAISLGKAVIAVPGTLVRATVNRADPTATLSCNSLTVQALATNVGRCYLGSSGLVRASLTGVYAVVPIPSINSDPPFPIGHPDAQAAFNAADFWVDADNASDGVLITIVR